MLFCNLFTCLSLCLFCAKVNFLEFACCIEIVCIFVIDVAVLCQNRSFAAQHTYSISHSIGSYWPSSYYKTLLTHSPLVLWNWLSLDYCRTLLSYCHLKIKCQSSPTCFCCVSALERNVCQLLFIQVSRDMFCCFIWFLILLIPISHMPVHTYRFYQVARNRKPHLATFQNLATPRSYTNLSYRNVNASFSFLLLSLSVSPLFFYPILKTNLFYKPFPWETGDNSPTIPYCVYWYCLNCMKTLSRVTDAWFILKYDLLQNLFTAQCSLFCRSFLNSQTWWTFSEYVHQYYIYY